jgi:hypothetical protein
MLAIIMVMSSYYSGEDEERRKQKNQWHDSTFSEENKDIKGKNPKRNSKEYI